MNEFLQLELRQIANIISNAVESDTEWIRTRKPLFLTYTYSLCMEFCNTNDFFYICISYDNSNISIRLKREYWENLCDIISNTITNLSNKNISILLV